MNGGKIRIIDISEPTQPEQMGVFDSPRNVRRAPHLWSHDNRNIRLWGVDVIDVSDPCHPILAGKRPCKGYECWGLLVDGQYVYTAQFRNEKLLLSSGLGICRWWPCQDTVIPAHIWDFRATDATNGRVTHSWTNPANAWHEPSDWCGAKVVRNELYYPRDADHGTVVYGERGSSFVDTVPKIGPSYFYTALSYDEAGNYSSPVSCALDMVQAESQIPTAADIIRQMKKRMTPKELKAAV